MLRIIFQKTLATLLIIALPLMGIPSFAHASCDEPPAAASTHAEHADADHAHHDHGETHSSLHKRTSNCSLCGFCTSPAMSTAEPSLIAPNSACRYGADTPSFFTSVDLDQPQHPPQFVRA